MEPAHDLGCQAAALDLETLDVARFHETALARLKASSSRGGLIKRADLFFAEAITPIEMTHRAAIETNARLIRLSKTLGRRTADLAVSHAHFTNFDPVGNHIPGAPALVASAGVTYGEKTVGYLRDTAAGFVNRPLYALPVPHAWTHTPGLTLLGRN